jgi:xanthosine utilization system XapX-like protein
MSDLSGICMVGLLICTPPIIWLLSRYLGLVGTVLGHIVIAVIYLLMAGIAMSTGTYQYDGMISLIGLLVQAFVLNCLLLPVAGFALWTRHRARTR